MNRMIQLPEAAARRRMIPITTRPAKSHYSESEAAVAIGVSVEDLRTLIRSHILKSDEDATNVPSATYQPSDLLVLRMLLNGVRPAEPAPQPEVIQPMPA
jgi:hypothetical protein